jgi:hypothetical protein
LVVVFIWILYQARQGKEREGRQSEKEGSKLREMEWFPGVRQSRFSKIPIQNYVYFGTHIRG